MDPMSALVTALVLGASTGMRATAEKLIVDGYAGIKAVIVRKWGHERFLGIERAAAKNDGGKAVTAELVAAGVMPDQELLAAAGKLIELIMKLDPEAARLAGFVGFLKSYLSERGPAAHQAYLGPPKSGTAETVTGTVSVATIYEKFIDDEVALAAPQHMTVSGALFPCALLSSGWWDTRGKKRLESVAWNNKVQEWLFHGFDRWGPSWDFSWNFDDRAAAKDRPYFIAQLGDGDEANSIPVLIPADKALRLHDIILGDLASSRPGRWAGFDAKVSGILGHRRHFESHLDPAQVELFGGLLDYCLFVDPDDTAQRIEILTPQTSVYSGYLWLCLAPEELVAAGTATLADCYFVWEHTNFASRDAIAYNLDSLRRKTDFLKDKFGKLELVQKSSLLVPDTPRWPQKDFYDLMAGKRRVVI
jgi:hypothetical protein